MREPWLKKYLSDVPKLVSAEMGNIKVMGTFLQSSQKASNAILSQIYPKHY